MAPVALYDLFDAPHLFHRDCCFEDMF
jgi:hypothetical protein